MSQQLSSKVILLSSQFLHRAPLKLFVRSFLLNAREVKRVLKKLADLLRRFPLTTTRPRRIVKKKKIKKNSF
jgi:hypothetical protein